VVFTCFLIQAARSSEYRKTQGVTVGIDVAAYRGALAAGGPTIRWPPATILATDGRMVTSATPQQAAHYVAWSKRAHAVQNDIWVSLFTAIEAKVVTPGP
jgi:hypothetical protein